MNELLLFALGLLVYATFCSASTRYKKDQEEYQEYRKKYREFFDED